MANNENLSNFEWKVQNDGKGFTIQLTKEILRKKR